MESCYTYRCGDHEVFVVPDGSRTFPLSDEFVPNATREELNGALAEAGMPSDQMTIVFNPLLLKTGGKTVLIDAGNGAGRGASAGRLVPNLGSIGITPESIDCVVISHFHRDHIDGLLAPDDGAQFPNAEILVPAPEWDFWMDDGNMAQAEPGRMQELFQNARRVFDGLRSRVRTYPWDSEVLPGLTAMGTPGHSVGHTSFMLSSGNDSVFIQCDVTNHPALFVHHPDWYASFDQDPAQALATRKRIYEMLVAERLPVQGFHHPVPGLSFVERAESGYRLVPIDWPVEVAPVAA